MVVNEHTGPMSMRCKAELGLEQVGDFVPIVDYTPVGGSALDSQLLNDPSLPQLSQVTIEKNPTHMIGEKTDPSADDVNLEMQQIGKSEQNDSNSTSKAKGFGSTEYEQSSTSRQSKKTSSRGNTTARPVDSPLSPQSGKKSRKSKQFRGDPNGPSGGKAIA